MTDLSQLTHHVIGGGTVNHIRAHTAFAAVAYGGTARRFQELLEERGVPSQLHLTRMANAGQGDLETNADVARLTQAIVDDPMSKIVFFNPALADFEGQIGDVESGKYADRLHSREEAPVVQLRAADKIVPSIRAQRKDIFLIASKTTSGATPEEQYQAGLALLKGSSANLVLANDLVTRRNMIIVPEEARYFETTDREEVLRGLADMTVSRAKGHFTRSSVVEGPLVPWYSPSIPGSLRKVVNHLIARGAYQPFRGKTAGHFAVRGEGPDEFLTSVRKSDFNRLPSNFSKFGLVRVVADEDGDHVTAYGAKPSVGGQSQRIVFSQHADKGLDCIAHWHGELRADAPDNIPVREQWRHECGSHECGQNTSDGLREIEPGIHAVMLENHGPNIVFSRDTDADRVISFIERNFELGRKTGGAFTPAYAVA